MKWAIQFKSDDCDADSRWHSRWLLTGGSIGEPCKDDYAKLIATFASAKSAAFWLSMHIDSVFSDEDDVSITICNMGS